MHVTLTLEMSNVCINNNDWKQWIVLIKTLSEKNIQKNELKRKFEFDLVENQSQQMNIKDCNG